MWLSLLGGACDVCIWELTRKCTRVTGNGSDKSNENRTTCMETTQSSQHVRIVRGARGAELKSKLEETDIPEGCVDRDAYECVKKKVWEDIF